MKRIFRKRLAKDGRFLLEPEPMKIEQIPYIKESSDFFRPYAGLPWSVFLDSCHHPLGRFDIIAVNPVIRIRTCGKKTLIEKNSITSVSTDNPLEIVKNFLPKVTEINSNLPFIGGAIGYFSYDLARRLETLPKLAKNDCEIPQMCIGIYENALVTDHQTKQSFFVSFDPARQFADVFAALEDPPAEQFSLLSDFTSNMSEGMYSEAFRKVKNYIYAGDCYQVNLAQRFQAKFSGSPWLAYLRLRKNNPAPFAAYLNYPWTTILSLSPERFLKCIDNYIETKPIKGTRPRILNDMMLDATMQRELLNSEKDRAENLMIVDLLRNDLGKTCEYGSIKVPKLFALESFATVHHLVSTVTGKLAADQTCLDLLRGAFPGGSITGAPKIRAMEIIEELEPHRRNIYCGSIGYISNHQRMDTNIAIRTLYTANNHIYCAAGGGLVADSNENLEYQETFDKVNVLLNTLRSMRG